MSFSIELPQTYTFSLCIDRGGHTIVDTTDEVPDTREGITRAKRTVQRLMNEYTPTPKAPEPARKPSIRSTGTPSMRRPSGRDGFVERMATTGKITARIVREATAMYKQRHPYITPLECERLQGYLDGWTDIGDWSKTDKKGKSRTVSSADSLRYKALGNSIALPPWAYVLTRLSLCAAEEPTMASLFDGIGGFPLIWEWLNGKGPCLWASEN